MARRPRILINGMNALLGGGQTYLINLLKELPEAEVSILLPEELNSQFKGLPDLNIINVGKWNKNIFTRTLYENLILPSLTRDLEVDVYFSAGGILPLRRVQGRMVSAFRNMLPFSGENIKKFPFGLKRVRYYLLRSALKRSFAKAHAVIFISNYAKEIIDAAIPKRRGIDEVIYHGVGDQYRRKDRIALPRPIDLPYEYVLYVSIINVYKSHLEVVKAWSELKKQRETNEKLVFIGPENGRYAKQVRSLIAELGLEHEILLLGKIPYGHLPNYYQNAKVNLFASTCENCPNILLEALAAETPILCSNIQPMPEIAGDSVLYFNPSKPTELVDRLKEVLDNSKLQNELSSKAKLQSEKYNWKSTRQKTWDLLLKVAKS